MDNQNAQIQELTQVMSMMIDELTKIKNENASYKQAIDALKQTVLIQKEMETRLAEELGKYERQFAIVSDLFRKEDNRLDNIKYEIWDMISNNKQPYIPKIYDYDYTFEKLQNGASIARYGDGEFSIMTNRERQPFQSIDPALSARLREVIQVQDENFLVGIGNLYDDLSEFNSEGKTGIYLYLTEEIRKEHYELLDKNRTYHNAYITRPFAQMANNRTGGAEKTFNRFKELWRDRNIIMVEGKLTRLGVGNDLFDTAASIRRVEGPAVNSFSRYDDILRGTIKHYNDGDLVLIAMGPSAGVLAYDLFKEGIQAMDIGHIDLEYEWFLRDEGQNRCEVKTKYNNEYTNGARVEEIDDPEYFSQIVEDFSE